jgi:hypothetical protein
MEMSSLNFEPQVEHKLLNLGEVLCSDCHGIGKKITKIELDLLEFCNRCNGNGKYTWIQNAFSERGLPVHDVYDNVVLSNIELFKQLLMQECKKVNLVFEIKIYHPNHNEPYYSRVEGRF